MLAKYKKMGKSLSKEEMKKVSGGLYTCLGLPKCNTCQPGTPNCFEGQCQAGSSCGWGYFTVGNDA